MLDLLLEVLAVYRLAQLISVDDGPFDCFKRLRLAVGRLGQRVPETKTLADLVNCPYCTGIWFALFVVIVTRAPRGGLRWLAIAGGQAFLQSISDRQGV